MKMSEHKMYKFLSKITTSEYQGLCTDQIKALLPLHEAQRYLTFLVLQNDFNKSSLL